MFETAKSFLQLQFSLYLGMKFSLSQKDNTAFKITMIISALWLYYTRYQFPLKLDLLDTMSSSELRMLQNTTTEAVEVLGLSLWKLLTF